MAEINNFILVQENAFDDELCDSISLRGKKYIEDVSNDILEPTHANQGRSQYENGRLGRHDYQIFMPDESSFIDVFKKTSEVIFEVAKVYREAITTVADYRLYNPMVKFQWTPIGGGFHPWHIEHGGGSLNSRRVLVWMIYLNDVDDGGETEFLYQMVKVKPKKGTLVMWPAGLTHPHRGNPPYSNEKFILTGWLMCPNCNEVEEAFALADQFKDGIA